jgi:hypothetical protein
VVDGIALRRRNFNASNAHGRRGEGEVLSKWLSGRWKRDCIQTYLTCP